MCTVCVHSYVHPEYMVFFYSISVVEMKCTSPYLLMIWNIIDCSLDPHHLLSKCVAPLVCCVYLCIVGVISHSVHNLWL